MKKRLLSILLAALMLVGLLPTVAFAEGVVPPDGNVVYVGTAPKGSTDTYYATLKEAVASVTDSTPTTIVMKKTEYSVFTETSLCTVANGEDITLDLNGNMAWYINTSGKSSQVFNVASGGKLTIMDSKDIHENGTGGGQLVSGYTPTWTWSGIEGDYSGSYASNVVTNNGTVVVKSGLLCNTSGSGSAVYAIDNYYSGKITVDGGKVQANKSSAIRQFNGTVANGEPQNVVTVNGGIIDGNWMGIQIQTGYVGKIIVNGGTIIGGDYSLSTPSTKKDNVGSKLEIHGGTFDSSTGYGYCSVFSDVEIDGGIFNAAYYSSKTGYITGGTFNNGALVMTDEDYFGMFDNEGNFCSYDKQFDDAGNIIGRTPTEPKYDSPWDKKAYWEDLGYTFVEDPTAPGVYFVCEDFPLDISYLAPNYTTIPSEVVEEDGYVDVVPAYAAVTFDYDCVYTDTNTDDEYDQEYYTSYNYSDVSYDYFETITEALNSEGEFEASYLELYGGEGKSYEKTGYKYALCHARNFLVRLTRNTNEVITLPVGVTFMVPNELSFSAKNILAPEGMVVAKEVKGDGTYYTVRAEGQKTNIETKTNDDGQAIQVNVGTEDAPDMKNVPAIEISGSKNGEDTNPVALVGDELNKAAVEAAEKIKENEAVTEFKDVGINEALVDSSEAKNKEQKVDVKVDAVVVTQESAIVETLTGNATTNTTSYQQSFDVKPMVKAEAPAEDATIEEKALYKKDANNEWWKIIPNEDIEGEITFRLPIESAIAKDTVAVYHKEDGATDEGKGDFIGFFPIQSEIKNNQTFKFVELKASEFSVYTYEIMTQVSQNSAFAVVNTDGSYTGYKTLSEDDGLNAALTGTEGKNVILLKDYTLAEPDTLPGGVEFTLDLDGHKLSGNAGNTLVTIKNSDTENQRTLEAIGTYANDVSAFAGDEYDAKIPDGGVTYSELFKKSSGDYTVVVTASTTNDRDKTNDATAYDESKISEDANGNKVAESGYRTTHAKVDVFSGDKVTVSVVVNGANFAAADVTLKWDTENFTLGNGLGDRPVTGWTINTTAGTARFYNAFAGNDHYPAGYTLGTFKFTAKDGTDAKLDEIFEIVNTDTTKAYIAASWTSGTVASAAPALTADQITNDYANIRLKQMTATVTPATNLFYRASGWKLLEDGYTAKSNVDNSAITDATIKYAVLTKAQVEGTPYTGAEGTTESTTVPGYVAGEEPKTPTSYETSQPMPTNADDYVIFWQLSKPGYITVEGQESVSIAPLNVDLIWTAPTDKSTGANKETMTAPTPGEKLNDGVTLVPEDVNVWGGYSTAGFNNPTASANALNTSYPATVTMTASPNDVTELKSVGSYTFTADLGPNFNISNPTYTVLIDGNKFEGYALSDDAEVFFDDETHEFIGTGDVVDVEDYSDDEEINATLKVEYSVNDGEWTTEKPNASAVGTYNIKMRVTADGYYTFTDEKTFEIKAVQYYTEKVDYVTGWDLVLVYTDETVPSFTYTYNGVKQVMYDVTDFGYKLGTVWNAKHTEITTDGTQYAHVYGIVVYGNAETTNVLPSNNTLADDFKVKLTAKGRLDVNYTTEDDQGHSLNGAGKIDIQDLVATQAVYNVNTEKYMDDALLFLGVDKDGAPVASNIMRIVLRADVSGDKQVDTYDCSQIKAAS